jgi:hypothetical protein
VSKPTRFTAADLKRAVEAMRKASCIIYGAEIKPDGTIVVLTAPRGGITASDANPLDRVLHR